MLGELSDKGEAPTAVIHGNPAVLIIDDDFVLRRSLVALFKAHHISTATARHAEGLELYRRTSPAVVLVDVVTPMQDGIDTIMQMRLERPEVKIVAMSNGGRIGHMPILDIVHKLGADAALAKPLDATEIMAMICRLLDRAPNSANEPHHLDVS